MMLVRFKATSHGFSPQKVAIWKERVLISGKFMLVNYYNLAQMIYIINICVFQSYF